MKIGAVAGWVDKFEFYMGDAQMNIIGYSTSDKVVNLSVDISNRNIIFTASDGKTMTFVADSIT